MNFYNGSASSDVKLQGKRFIHPFFHLCVYFFVCSSNRLCIPSVCVCLREKKSHAGLLEESAGARQNSLTFFFYCKDPVQTVWMHMHVLILNFVAHMYSCTPSHISCESVSTVKTQRS